MFLDVILYEYFILGAVLLRNLTVISQLLPKKYNDISPRVWTDQSWELYYNSRMYVDSYVLYDTNCVHLR